MPINTSIKKVIKLDEIKEEVPSLPIDSSKNFNFDQDEAIDAILKETDGTYHGSPLTRQIIFANKWLDFEPKYRAEGWAVDFDKPAYNEDYTAFFVLSVKK